MPTGPRIGIYVTNKLNAVHDDQKRTLFGLHRNKASNLIFSLLDITLPTRFPTLFVSSSLVIFVYDYMLRENDSIINAIDT